MTVDKKPLPQDLIDGLLANYKKPEDLIGEGGLLKQLTKALVERALQAEMATHLGHGKHQPVENATGNTRNGKSKKTLKGEFGELPIERRPENRHAALRGSTVSFKPRARISSITVSILGLPRGDKVRYRLSRLTPAAFASAAIPPRRWATLRSASSNTAGSPSSNAAFR